MLLLVLDAGHDEEAEPVEVLASGGPDQVFEAPVHGFAEAVDLVGRGPGHEAPVIAADAGAKRLVVRVQDVLQPAVLAVVAAEGLRMFLAKNQLVCPRFHHGGETSGIDWTR